MQNVQGNFDFTDTVEAIRPWMDASHPDFYDLNRDLPEFLSERNKLMQNLFAQFPHYLTEFFDDAGIDAAISNMNMVPDKVEDVLITQMGFPDAEQRASEISQGRWRFYEDFLLTEDETSQSIEFLKSNEQFSLTFCLLGAAVQAYFDDAFQAMSWSEKGKFTEEYGAFSETQLHMTRIREQILSAEQFVRELLPIFAFGFIDGKDVTEKNMALGLCDIFRKKAMQGHEDYYGRKNPIHCPFGPILGEISSIALDENELGKISVQDERRSGALFCFLYEKAGQILADDRYGAPNLSSAQHTVEL